MAHHPTGNSKIERVWQYVSKCIRQMTKKQHDNWPAYLRLMEHVWGTIKHTTLGVTPFEAAHGLPARSAQTSMAEVGDYMAPSTMDQEGITAMQTTATAYVQILKQIQLQDTTRRAQRLNRRGFNHELQEGDRVSFFIPPSADEAKRAGRKPKHLQQFKGPATIIKKLSPTTFAIKYRGSTYGRCASELRKYNSDGTPELMDVNQDNIHEFRIGDFVALCDHEDPKHKYHSHYHIGEVINIADGHAHVRNYATLNSHPARAGWSILYQKDNGVYTTIKPKRSAERKEIVDKVPLTNQNFVRHFNVLMTEPKSGQIKIAIQSRRHLKRKKLTHHVLGKSFP